MKSRPDQSGLASHQCTPVQDYSSSHKIPAEVIKPWILPPPQTYIFENVNIVDPVSGTIIPSRTVHLAGGCITAITTTAKQAQPQIHVPNTIRIDGTGKYLTPGLIDAHVHLTSVPGEPDLHTAMALPATVSLLRQPFQANAMLARGYTTVRDCGGASLALKTAIADGVFPGPRLFIAGHALSQTGGHGDRRGGYEQAAAGEGCCCAGSELAGLSEVVDGVPAVLRAAREQLRQGADFLKLMVGGGVASPTDRLSSTQFTDGEIQAAAEVAAASDTFATAHAYTARAIRRAVENGVRGIEHGNFVDEATARFMAERGVYLTPTLIAYQAMADPKYAAFLPVESREKNEMVLKAGLASLRVAYEAGVTMCLGSDLLSFLGVEQLGEFGLRAQVLPCKEVLRHATVNPAKMLGQEKRLGQVRDGFVADVLLLNANPLEDITVFERPEKHLLAVIKEGRVYNSRWSKLPVDVYQRTSLLE